MLAPMGLRLSPEKTRVVHMTRASTFLGFDIRRMRKRGTQKYYVYTKPSRKAIQAIKDKVRAKTYRSTRHMDLDELIASLNRSLAGGRTTSGTECPRQCSARSTSTWGRLMRWIRAKYEGRHRLGMRALRTRFCDQGWRFACNGVDRRSAASGLARCYRGGNIPTPWTEPAAAASG